MRVSGRCDCHGSRANHRSVSRGSDPGDRWRRTPAYVTVDAPHHNEGGVMVGEICSWVRCQAEVVAWMDGGAWCGGHALRLLAGHRPLPRKGSARTRETRPARVGSPNTGRRCGGSRCRRSSLSAPLHLGRKRIIEPLRDARGPSNAAGSLVLRRRAPAAHAHAGHVVAEVDVPELLARARPSQRS